MSCRHHHLYSTGDCSCGQPRPPAQPVPGQLALVDVDDGPRAAEQLAQLDLFAL